MDRYWSLFHIVSHLLQVPGRTSIYVQILVTFLFIKLNFSTWKCRRTIGLLCKLTPLLSRLKISEHAVALHSLIRLSYHPFSFSFFSHRNSRRWRSHSKASFGPVDCLYMMWFFKLFSSFPICSRITKPLRVFLPPSKPHRVSLSWPCRALLTIAIMNGDAIFIKWQWWQIL